MKVPSLLRRSLALRLALVYGLLGMLVVAGLGLSVYFSTERYLRGQARQRLDELAAFYAAYTAATAPDEDRLAALAPQIVAFFAPQAGYDVRVFEARSGTLLAASRDLGSLPSSAALAALDYRRPTLFLPGSEDRPGRIYAARPVATTTGSPLAVVEISRNWGDLESFLATLRLILVAAGGVALAIILVASLLLARRITRPLQQMEAATQAIAAGDFERRLSVAREDEVGRLSTSINRMAADLARLEAARREFIARISHDLRTPLTAIKGFVVNLQDSAPPEMQPALATMDQQADRLIGLVNDLLTLSRLQRGRMRLRSAELDLAQVARSAAALAGARAQRLGVTLNLQLAQDLPAVPGDADRLQQVILNLLDNALKATPAGGTVYVEVELRWGEAVLSVVDSGCGLTAEEAARAFEPYFRGQGGGAGLGLAIAREIVEGHGGHIWLRQRAEGGAEAGFALPCSADTGRRGSVKEQTDDPVRAGLPDRS
jgi:signal transduction histidine kinase